MSDRPMRATLRNGRTDWYRIVNHMDRSFADVFIYDEIGFYGVTADQFVQDLAALQVATINLRLNSPGGEVFDGVAIYNALKNHKAAVMVTVDGLAASAASFIAMAGNKVTMRRGAQMMIHEASGLCIGSADDMRQLADNLDRVSATIASFYAERAGGTVDDWRERMRAETWFTGAEAVAAGLADESDDFTDAQTDDEEPAVEPDAEPEPATTNTARTVITAEHGPDIDVAPPQRTWDLSIYRYAGRDNAPPPDVPPAPSSTEQPITAEAPENLGGFTFDPALFKAAIHAAMSKEAVK